MGATVQFRIRFKTGLGPMFGPGKVALLEAIEEHGSISAAARNLRMSYRRAWMLVDEMNQVFSTPLVESAVGGKAGGGAHLTDLGRRMAKRYRLMEKNAEKGAARDIDAILRQITGTG